MCIHRLRTFNVIRERNLLRRNLIHCFAGKNYLFVAKRCNELIEIAGNLIFIRTHIDRTNVPQNLALLHRHARDLPHEHLGVLEHLVIALDTFQHIREIPVLPHERILGQL